MSLDIKIRQAVLDTAIRHLLKNRQKSPSRTARSMIELAALSRPELTPDKKQAFTEELTRYLSELNCSEAASCPGEEVSLIESWLSEHLSLPS